MYVEYLLCSTLIYVHTRILSTWLLRFSDPYQPGPSLYGSFSGSSCVVSVLYISLYAGAVSFGSIQ